MPVINHIPLKDGLFNQDELDSNHEDLLRDFIKDGIEGLKGMLLISIRDNTLSTNVEVRGGSTVDDAIRAALCVLEGTLTNTTVGELRLLDSDKREVIEGVISVLTKISGSRDGDVILVHEDASGNLVETSRRPKGPSLEDDEDDDSTRH